MGWFRVLAIGGSDSGGGAGIEADVKTITALGGHAMTAITAVTAQDTTGIAAIAPVPPDLVGRAIRMVVADLGVDAIKLGMLGSAGTAEEVARAISTAAPAAPLVLDPVLASTSGTALAGAGALAIIRDHLLPRATLITPNRDEAAALTGGAVDTAADALRAGAALLGMGAQAVLLKGGHFEGDTLVDRLFTAEGMTVFTHQRIATRHTHGTGCTLASAIACGLARGLGLAEAIAAAEAFLAAALRASPGYGSGHGPLGHARAAMPLQDRPPS
ncbi:MAG: bifunctional hydroxymethylpyrimidine kinase/phosphomethylpyrimidine kinase [Acidiphilium sp. 37-67-22]|nr:MAG: bifunctional hydroxymethylpyrimidine kinase/phosphomethylpyrimidine kinase [Acidiphilium sp. 37-67-22]HQT74781.1 bifunctional hydroxymethylpyrimidine kinase/phosphomethylpyrimidine kinase [Acidiphilium sp.]